MNDIFELERRHSSGVYAKHEIAFVRGEGARLWDQEGREYIDCMAGPGVANLGHAHPTVLEAITVQARQLITCPETYYNDRRAELMTKLGSLLPGAERVFLCNSGTEAIEAALKFARVSTGRTKFIAAIGGFHGRTMGALSATWNKRYREPFKPLVPGFEHVAYNNLTALEEAIDGETAAVILEVVQGAGGVHIGERTFLEEAQRLCQESGALLIIDEVQTGFGRTGKLLAVEHFGLNPDLLCLAKSIAGGLPMGAVLIGPRVENLAPGMHATTFGGNVSLRGQPGCVRGDGNGELGRSSRQKGRSAAGSTQGTSVADNQTGTWPRTDDRGRNQAKGGTLSAGHGRQGRDRAAGRHDGDSAATTAGD